VTDSADLVTDSADLVADSADLVADAAGRGVVGWDVSGVTCRSVAGVTGRDVAGATDRDVAGVTDRGAAGVVSEDWEVLVREPAGLTGGRCVVGSWVCCVVDSEGVFSKTIAPAAFVSGADTPDCNDL
jgi:hypothetical protein